MVPSEGSSPALRARSVKVQEEYTAGTIRATCGRLGIRQSMASLAPRWITPPPPRVSSALKNEMYYRQSFPDRARARSGSVVADYIEVFYNRKRLHSALGCRTPAEVLTDYQTAAAAA